MAGENDPWLEMLIALMDVVTTMEVNADLGVGKWRGEVIELGMDRVLYQHCPGNPKSLWSLKNLCCHKSPSCPALPVGSWGSSPGSAGRPLSPWPHVLPPRVSRNGCVSQSRHSCIVERPPTKLTSIWAPASWSLRLPCVYSSSRSVVTQLLLWALPRTTSCSGQVHGLHT